MAVANGLQIRARNWFFTGRALLDSRLIPGWLFALVLIWSQSSALYAESEAFKDARRLVFSGQINEGLVQLEEMAQEENIDALLELSYIYTQGWYLEEDYELAEKYALAAKRLGSKRASYHLAEHIVYYSSGVEDKSVILALQEEGFAEAWCSYVAPEGFSAEERTEKCLEFHAQKAHAGNIRSQLYLGNYHPSTEQRGHWRKEAERQGSYYARLESLRAAWRLRPSGAVLDEAITLAYDANLYMGQPGLIPFYWLPGYNYAEDYSRHIEAMQSAEIQKTLSEQEISDFKIAFLDWLKGPVSLETLTILAANMRKGHGNTLSAGADDDLAYTLFSRCAEDSESDYFAWCLNWQALMLDSGRGVEKDVEGAFPLFLRAARRGDIWAIGNVCEAYIDGVGVTADYAKAMEFCSRAIDAGNNRAAYDLGRLYENGWGVPRDLMLAKNYYLIAAETYTEGVQSVEAMLALAKIYETQADQRDSLELAADWYMSAIAIAEKATENSMDLKAADITAQAKSGLAAIQLLQDSTFPDAHADVRFGNYHALIVTNEDYSDLTDLSAPIKDGRDLGALLGDRYGFQVEYLLDGRRNDLLAKVDQYRRRLGPEDNFLIYYAGHGTFDTELNLGFWQLADARSDASYTWVDTDRLTQTLNLFRTRNILVVADSCFSGAVFRVSDEPNLTFPDDSAAMQTLIDRKTRVALTSGGMEPVIDSSGGDNSIFAEELLGALAASEEVATAAQIFARVRGRVASRSRLSGYEQVPEFSPLYGAGHDGGDFIFRRVGSPQ